MTPLLYPIYPRTNLQQCLAVTLQLKFNSLQLPTPNCSMNLYLICMMEYNIKHKIVNCEKCWQCDVTWSLPPPPPPVTNCHTSLDPIRAWLTLWVAPMETNRALEEQSHQCTKKPAKNTMQWHSNVIAMTLQWHCNDTQGWTMEPEPNYDICCQTMNQTQNQAKFEHRTHTFDLILFPNIVTKPTGSPKLWTTLAHWKFQFALKSEGSCVRWKNPLPNRYYLYKIIAVLRNFNLSCHRRIYCGIVWNINT